MTAARRVAVALAAMAGVLLASAAAGAALGAVVGAL